MRVLVVHHDRWARLVLADVLAGAGFGVAEASNGMTALRLAAQMRPDVVVLGTALPELAAHDVRTALRADPETRRIGVFVLRERTAARGGSVSPCVRGCRRVIARRRVARGLRPQSMVRTHRALATADNAAPSLAQRG